MWAGSWGMVGYGQALYDRPGAGHSQTQRAVQSEGVQACAAVARAVSQGGSGGARRLRCVRRCLRASARAPLLPVPRISPGNTPEGVSRDNFGVAACLRESPRERLQRCAPSPLVTCPRDLGKTPWYMYGPRTRGVHVTARYSESLSPAVPYHLFISSPTVHLSSHVRKKASQRPRPVGRSVGLSTSRQVHC